MRDEVLIGRELLKCLDIRINGGKVKIKRTGKGTRDAAEKEPTKASSDGDCCIGGVLMDANDENVKKKFNNVTQMMKIDYVETNKIDVRQGTCGKINTGLRTLISTHRRRLG